MNIPVAELLDTTARSYPNIPPTILVTTDIGLDVDAVHAYPHQVEVILHHLFVNAIQAMPDGGQIVLRARDAGRFVAIYVEDTVPGIPEAQRAAILAPFASTKGKGNWGLGLWSSLLHARRNGGDLTVESTVGKGTTFTLQLPKEGPDLWAMR